MFAIINAHFCNSSTQGGEMKVRNFDTSMDGISFQEISFPDYFNLKGLMKHMEKLRIPLLLTS